MADAAAIRELSEKMVYARGRLLDLIQSLSEEQASTPPRPGEWNPKEQMAHLCEMDSMYRAWVEKALEEDGADLDRVPPKPVAIRLEEANRHLLAELGAEMARQRQATLQLIASLKPQDYERVASNSRFGTLTVLQWLRSYYRHDRMHYDQISGQEITYRPRFLDGGEPDQRRPSAG